MTPDQSAREFLKAWRCVDLCGDDVCGCAACRAKVAALAALLTEVAAEAGATARVDEIEIARAAVVEARRERDAQKGIVGELRTALARLRVAYGDKARAASATLGAATTELAK